MSVPDPKAVLADLASRRRQCREAILTLADFYGLDPAPWLDDQTPAAPRARRPPRGDNGRPHGALSAKGEQILAALKAHGSPISPRDLQERLKMTRGVLSYHLKPLEQQGLVAATGTTHDRRIRLL